MRTLAAMLVSVSLVGCAATSADGEQSSSSSTAKLGALSPVGTFRASELSPGVYESITFLANGTYRAAAVARCSASDCTARLVVAIEGTWTSDARGGLSAQLTLRASNLAHPPLSDGGAPYIATHEVAHASLNYVDEYSEPGLETNRLPTPATPFGGAPGYRLDHLAGGCTDDNACVNTVCEQGAPQCTAFGACGCAVTTVIEAN